uniref:Uncharacterized protein n=1 Tax=Rhizophora mucronata TaxID=61149 RepID=A0A2P2N992_RHIMU
MGESMGMLFYLSLSHWVCFTIDWAVAHRDEMEKKKIANRSFLLL